VTPNRRVLVMADPNLLAQFVATRLLATLVDAQTQRGFASVVLTGGGIGTASLVALADHPARNALDWSRLDVFWGDERFVPADDTERNDRGAERALLDHVPVTPNRVHRIASSDDVATPEAAAAAYAEVLAQVAREHGHPEPVPRFDVILLGMGPEGHIASIFPGDTAVHAGEPVVAVRDCPKAPPTRVSLTFPSIRAANEAWVLATSPEKASAVAHALSGTSPTELPAAGVHGRSHTLFLLDEAAAGEVPVELRPRR